MIPPSPAVVGNFVSLFYHDLGVGLRHLYKYDLAPLELYIMYICKADLATVLQPIPKYKGGIEIVDLIYRRRTDSEMHVILFEEF